jgi:hypothetical protein
MEPLSRGQVSRLLLQPVDVRVADVPHIRYRPPHPCRRSERASVRGEAVREACVVEHRHARVCVRTARVEGSDRLLEVRYGSFSRWSRRDFRLVVKRLRHDSAQYLALLVINRRFHGIVDHHSRRLGAPRRRTESDGRYLLQIPRPSLLARLASVSLAAASLTRASKGASKGAHTHARTHAHASTRTCLASHTCLA